ncbi:MAG: UDP-glucose 4-epimerase GalE [Rhodobacterales bacterium]|nr:UDP-glucose 4-epimerase GalE [Rhodobacterales bacterium]
MSKVLVTGGAGYIGSHTVLALLQSGNDVIVVDNFSNSSAESLNRVSRIAGRSPLVIEGNITDVGNIEKIFAENTDISSVIHFAALKAVGESTQHPLKYYHNNVTGSVILLDAMQRAGVKNLVFSSSCTVYGEPEKVPISEDFPVGSVSSPYGRTKYMMEEIIEDYAKSDPAFCCAVLRYFNPVGAHSSGEIGEDPNGIPDNLVPFVCQVATGKLDKLKVFGNDYPTPDGTAVRDYLHVVDLADAHIKALRALEQNKEGFICNLGTGTGSSVLDVIDAFEKANGIRIPYEFASRRSGDVTEAWADPTYAKKKLGWESNHNLVDMLRDAWNWQSKNPNGYK